MGPWIVYAPCNIQEQVFISNSKAPTFCDQNHICHQNTASSRVRSQSAVPSALHLYTPATAGEILCYNRPSRTDPRDHAGCTLSQAAVSWWRRRTACICCVSRGGQAPPSWVEPAYWPHSRTAVSRYAERRRARSREWHDGCIRVLSWGEWPTWSIFGSRHRI